MQRDLSRLAAGSFDLVVIGGGITGAFAAWDAALRGLSVALLERGDFGHATSAASSKVVHGGIRHLQQGNLKRVRESLLERRAFRRIAPHLVHPLPFLIPTYGHGLQGREILTLGMIVYEALGLDQNRIDDPQKHLPHFQVLSRQQALELEPGLPTAGLTGAIRYYECHMHNSERMTLAVVQAAVAAGAQVANYVEAGDFVRSASRVDGVEARDLLTGKPLTVRGRVVANVSGPWARHVLDRALGQDAQCSVGLSKGVHLVTRPLTQSGALALATRHQNEALINRGGRHFFMIPWRRHSLVGTTNVPYVGDPADVAVTETDIRDFIDEINAAYPAARLQRDEVSFAFVGLYPLIDKDINPDKYQGASQYQIYDHRRIDQVDGLVTVIGAKYTTARNLARKTIDLVLRKLDRKAPRCTTDRRPVVGGEIERYDDFLASVLRERPHALAEDVLRDMVLSYGSEFASVLRHVDEDSSWGERITGNRPVIAAEALHAVREEMAVRLGDVIFRRTGIGTIGHPGRLCLETCARIMAMELDWSEAHRGEEIETVEQEFVVSGDGGSGDQESAVEPLADRAEAGSG